MILQATPIQLNNARFLKCPVLKRLLLLLMLLSVTSCTYVINNAKKEFSNDLSATILESDDPEMIKKGVPSYLILVSSLNRGNVDNPDTLEAGAKLYGAYASSFADSAASKKSLSNHAFDYASRAICIRNPNLCDVRHLSYFEYEKRLKTVELLQVESLFIFASTWAGVIEASSSDWNVVAELPKVKAGIQRVLELDETIDNGNAQLYMAVMESILPPALGGKPEIAKMHYERAIEISGGTNLMAKVLYAEKYARMLFDRKLHDALLRQVLEAGTGAKDQTLVNTLAKQKAAELLADADDYF
jgi:hypothetical protein